MEDATSAAADDPDDADLMRRAAHGDRDAFAALYRRHQARVYRFARLMTGSSTAAEDIVQEVFLVVMRDAARYDPARAALTSYLYGVARHQTRRRRARDRQFVAFDGCRPDSSEPVADDDASATLERRQTLQQLRRAILSLPRRYREVVVLCDLQGVSYSDAATAMGCAIGTVRSRLHRARHLLTQKMGRTAPSHEDHPGLTERCA
jgi:RNA polymerase sigma-70 factor, ECF subfamily